MGFFIFFWKRIAYLGKLGTAVHTRFGGKIVLEFFYFFSFLYFIATDYMHCG